MSETTTTGMRKMARSTFPERVLAVSLALMLVTSVVASDAEGCGVYLSESSTGHSLGSYAGRGYSRGDTIGRHDAVVQITDIRHHNQEITDDERSDLEKFLSTCWSGEVTGGMFDAEEVISALGGPCFSSTGHVGMINAVIDQPSVLLRSDTDLLSAGYDEAISPGRGAFTTHHNMTLLAVDTIPAGMELFLDFGQEYTNHDDTDQANMDDYRKMDQAMGKMSAFFDKHAEALGPIAAADVYEFLKKEVIDITAEERAAAARSLLPKSYDGLRDIMDKGGSALHKHPEVKKNVDWLEKNAYCQDNLVAGISQIPQAGRGAFATRDIRAGDVVAPMPLVPILRGRDALSMTSSSHDDEDDEVIESTQLVYNYVLEHPQSSVLFYPAGPITNYINHAGKSANVKFAWSTKSWTKTDSSRRRGVDGLSDEVAIDIILDVVAARDIEKGEEVLIDYGDNWEKEWDKHTKQWEEAIQNWTPTAKTAMVLNDAHHGKGKAPRPFVTPAEVPTAGEMNDEHAELICYLRYDENKVERRRNPDGTRTRVYPWTAAPEKDDHLKNGIAFRGVNGVACTVLERTGDEVTGYKYLVSPSSEELKTLILVKNVPHAAVRYVDKAYRSPQFEQLSFRHAIEFPDEIFPNAWKDLSDGDVED